MKFLRAEERASCSAGCGESVMNWVGAFSGSHVLDSIPLRKASPYLGLSSHERRRERLCGVGWGKAEIWDSWRRVVSFTSWLESNSG